LFVIPFDFPIISQDPFWNQGGLDIPKTVLTTWQSLDYSQMKQLGMHSTKLVDFASFQRSSRIYAPSESVYHTFFFSVLKMWLRKGVFIGTNVDVPISQGSIRKKRADLILQTQHWKCVIEFEASDPPQDIEEYLNRTEFYRSILQCNEGWLVHVGITHPGSGYYYPTHPSTNAIFIWHDENFQCWKYWIRYGGEKKIIYENESPNFCGQFY